MKKWLPPVKRLPLIIAGLLAIWALSGLHVPGQKADKFAVQEFGRLPLVSNGRCQPLDSLGRNALLQMREKQTANLEPWKGAFEHPKIISATEWLMAMMMNSEVANAWPVLRIDNPDLKGLLNLPANADPDKQTDGKHFAWNALKTKIPDLQRETMRAGKVDQALRTPYDQALIRLSNVAGLYMRLQNTLQPQNAKDWLRELNNFSNNAVSGVAALTAQQAGQKFDEAAMERIMPDLERFNAMAELQPPMLIPPHHPERSKDDWSRTVDGLTNIARGEPTHFSLIAYAKMAGAYRAGDVIGFNQAVRDYRTALSPAFEAELKKGASEQLFNHFEPFYKAMTLYIIAFIAVLGFWFAPAQLEWLRRTAVAIVLVALAVHTGGLLFRMLLEGRPPVTNLYSSAIFIGWGACILGLILEAFWKNSIGLVISSTIGFITLIIAHHLSLTGDTMEMMRAVLDTNFWLATHVVVVTLGYASTFVAGFLALVYIILGVFTKKLSTTLNSSAAAEVASNSLKPALNTGKSLAKMVYGIVCFATLFSFVGTVLGGIWADQSWGRFWGWDPKENGALIIVLWNALILHARWGGMVRERGLMNLAIFGNIVTSWSWFGVNMLGIGLHAYGFMDAAFRWLMIFVASQLILIALGLLPLSLWRSFRKPSADVRPANLPTAVTV